MQCTEPILWKSTCLVKSLTETVWKQGEKKRKRPPRRKREETNVLKKQNNKAKRNENQNKEGWKEQKRGFYIVLWI